MSRRRSRVTLEERITSLSQAIELCQGRVPEEALAPARAVLDRAAQRRARGDGLVVVALAGGTGTGKSSLLNAVAGHHLAEVDVRRPTTSEPTAWVVGAQEEAGALLDWLEIPADRRHASPSGDGPEGLVLVDLPDIDSVVASNRAVADRLIERVDVLVWVVDPHKYAQQSLHEGYLGRLREHADVMWVVLNQADRLDKAAVRTVVKDLEGLVGGRSGPQVMATSAVTGDGIDELSRRLDREVAERRAVAERIAADIRTAATDLAAVLSPPGEDGSASGRSRDTDIEVLLSGWALTDALTSLAGVDRLVDHAARRYLDVASASSRTIVLHLLAVVGGLIRGLGGLGRAAGRLFGTARRSVSVAEPALTGTDIQHVLSELTARARQHLPWSWASRFQDRASQVAADLPTRLKAAAAGADAEPRRRWWWRAVAVVGSVVELAALVGAGWLLLARITDTTTLPSVPVVMLDDEVSLPGMILAVGVVAWIVLLLVRRVALRAGARRHRKAAGHALRHAVGEAVDQTAVAPLREELSAYSSARSALDVAR